MLGQHEKEHLSVNMVVNFFAVTVFATLMCVFWWFIASQEMIHAVKRKAKVLYTTRETLDEEPLLRDLATLLDTKMHQTQKEMSGFVDDSEAYRNAQNQKLMFMWMGPLISVYGGLLLAAVTYNVTRTHFANDPRHLSFGHWGGMIMVFFSYIPEILFFLFVIE
jgi:hypothetical protein